MLNEDIRLRCRIAIETEAVLGGEAFNDAADVTRRPGSRARGGLSAGRAVD